MQAPASLLQSLQLLLYVFLHQTKALSPQPRPLLLHLIHHTQIVLCVCVCVCVCVGGEEGVSVASLKPSMRPTFCLAHRAAAVSFCFTLGLSAWVGGWKGGEGVEGKRRGEKGGEGTLP